MGMPLDLSEQEFKRLPISEIDLRTRTVKEIYELFSRYQKALDTVSITDKNKAEFWGLPIATKRSEVENAEDTANKWPSYHANMARMQQPYHSAKEFLQLSAKDRASAFNRASGTERSAWEAVKRNYSSQDGWRTYSDSHKEFGLQTAYKEYDFINLSSADIDKLATHAKASLELYKNFKSLYEQSGQALPYQPEEIFKQGDLTSLQGKYRSLSKGWSSRVAYFTSCKRVGATPNWAAFDSKPKQEQDDGALLAKKKADKWEEYSKLCKKIEVAPDNAFLDCPLEEQDKLIGEAKEVLSNERKEKIKEVAEDVTIFVAGMLLEKATGNRGSSTTRNSTTRNSSIPKVSAPSASKIDRDSFAKQRQQYWKSEAEKSPSKYSPANLEKMKKGSAPVGSDGHPMELHHPGGEPNATLVPMTATDHRLGDNYEKNHPWLFEKK
jgi:hypothetical protein